MARFNNNQTLTYDDVLLLPKYSKVLPNETILASKFSTNISLQIPLVSSAMDTVTEADTAIIMAQEGGIGVIHKNLSFEEQAKEVEKVKKYEAGMILDPVTVNPDNSLETVTEITHKHRITGVLVVDGSQHLLGILTSRDMQFANTKNLKVKDVMTPRERLVTVSQGVDVEEAKKLLHRHRIEKLPVMGQDGKLKGLITIRDIKKTIDFPLSNRDQFGRLRVAAAVGVSRREFERAGHLVDAQVDALVIDTAHGHSRGVLEMVTRLKKEFNLDIVAGNVATKEACKDLIDAGADGIKVGMGPGSICTTRVVAGVGVSQMSALIDCAPVCLEAGIPFIADGGVKYSGDIVKALATGAGSVMIGSLFAGTDESPGEMVLYQGRSYKVYRGMGSLGSMHKGSRDRYGQEKVDALDKLVPEGIEGQVPYRGPLSRSVYQLVGGLRAGMGYVGAKNLDELRENAVFTVISSASLKEGHPHDVIITKEAPNYSLGRP